MKTMRLRINIDDILFVAVESKCMCCKYEKQRTWKGKSAEGLNEKHLFVRLVSMVVTLRDWAHKSLQEEQERPDSFLERFRGPELQIAPSRISINRSDAHDGNNSVKIKWVYFSHHHHHLCVWHDSTSPVIVCLCDQEEVWCFYPGTCWWSVLSLAVCHRLGGLIQLVLRGGSVRLHFSPRQILRSED